jgi:tryptophanyl-tRNA synthetase
LIPAVGRLLGVDGKAKMSKWQGNAIPLPASQEEISAAVRRMYTDPKHLKASDPGTVEGNVVFTYLDAFDADRQADEDLKAHYRRGGLGDMVLKQRLETILHDLLAPIRERRSALAQHPSDVLDVLRDGTRRARDETQATLDKIRDGLGLFTLNGDGRNGIQ